MRQTRFQIAKKDIIATFEKYNKKKNKLDYDVVGGYYGYDYAMEALKEEY